MIIFSKIYQKLYFIFIGFLMVKCTWKKVKATQDSATILATWSCCGAKYCLPLTVVPRRVVLYRSTFHQVVLKHNESEHPPTLYHQDYSEKTEHMFRWWTIFPRFSIDHDAVFRRTGTSVQNFSKKLFRILRLRVVDIGLYLFLEIIKKN